VPEGEHFMTDSEKIREIENLTGKQPIYRPDGTQTMQELYGLMPGRRCKECKHCKRYKYANVFYKCLLWKMTHSRKTDIRVNGAACGRFEEI
jgi:hypothetical protein